MQQPLIVGVLFEDGLPERVTDSILPLSERPVRLADRVCESWSATRNVQDQQCARGTLTGTVTYVRDGDTIVVGRMPVRLAGLATPERWARQHDIQPLTKEQASLPCAEVLAGEADELIVELQAAALVVAHC